jgi:hypothetical protein
MDTDMQSALVRFYASAAPDARGRMIDEIWGWSDAALEEGHDFVQWLFPLPEPSAFVDDAPLLTQADIDAFAASAALRETLRRSFRRMLDFYGFVLVDGRLVEPAPDFDQKSANWLRRFDHNYLRFTRILRALTLMGLRNDAVAFLAALEAVYRRYGEERIGERALGYWRAAVNPEMVPGGAAPSSARIAASPSR